MFLASSDMKKDKIHMIALMLLMNLFKLNAFGIFVIKVMNPTTNTTTNACHTSKCEFIKLD